MKISIDNFTEILYGFLGDEYSDGFTKKLEMMKKEDIDRMYQLGSDVVGFIWEFNGREYRDMN